MNKIIFSIGGTLICVLGVVGLCNEFYYRGKKNGAKELSLLIEQHEKGRIKGAKEFAEMLESRLRFV